jgi:curved DNA-binding protein CbpA
MASQAPFSDVITDAVARAVRRAVDDVGRPPQGQLESSTSPAPGSPAPLDLAVPPAEVLDPYEVVGVEIGAPWDDIVAAYRLRAKAWHPDVAGTPDPHGGLLRRLNAAYEELRIRRGKRSSNGVLQPSPVPRKRRDDEDDGNKTVDLTASEHAWWASTPIDPFGRDEQPAGGTEPEPEPEPEAPSSEVVPDDPYEVLRISPSATWDEIVVSYRKLARWYHPDGLVDPSPADLESCEDMIRRLNAAYAELRVRRGR